MILGIELELDQRADRSLEAGGFEGKIGVLVGHFDDIHRY